MDEKENMIEEIKGDGKKVEMEMKIVEEIEKRRERRKVMEREVIG